MKLRTSPFLNNFFNGSILIVKFFNKNVDAVVTTQKKLRDMSGIIATKNMKIGDHAFLFSERKKVVVNGLITDQLKCCSIMLKKWQPHQPSYNNK